MSIRLSYFTPVGSLVRAALAALCVTVSPIATAATTHDWQPLLDSELTQWRTYLGYPNPDTPLENIPRNAEGEYSQPVGYDRDERQVFSLQMQQGEPVLRISGEIYGGLFTRDTFSDYHLRLQFKWGEKKWYPREDLPMDSGILYHAGDEHGVDYWRAWPRSQEFQVIYAGVEGTTGDWWKIADSQITIQAVQPEADAPYQYSTTAEQLPFGGEKGVAITCRASHNNEEAKGEWNTLDLIVVGGRSLHIVNGEVVMALSGSAYSANGEVLPLTEGGIVLQSEAAEVFYRRIQIRSMANIPEDYQRYFK